MNGFIILWLRISHKQASGECSPTDKRQVRGMPDQISDKGVMPGLWKEGDVQSSVTDEVFG
jgi:hypothetical protein